MQVGGTLIAHGQAPEAGQSSKSVLFHPPVPPEAGAAFDTTPGDTGLDATGAALAAAAPVGVAFVGVQLGRAPSWPSPMLGPKAWHGVQRGCEHAAVVWLAPLSVMPIDGLCRRSCPEHR